MNMMSEMKVDAEAVCKCGCGGPVLMERQNRGFRKKGEPLTFIKGHNNRRDATERFEEKMVYMGDCIAYSGPSRPDGYGQFSVGPRKVLAHRFAYESKHGPVPVGFVLDHLCRNRICVNVSHLEVVTQSTNVLRGASPYLASIRMKLVPKRRKDKQCV